MEMSAILLSDLEFIKGVELCISPMGKVQLYLHRWKGKGNADTGCLGLFEILSAKRTYWMTQKAQCSGSWSYLSVQQVFKYSTKIQVDVGLSIGTKKIQPPTFGGRTNLYFVVKFSKYFAIFLHIYDFQSSQ